MKNKTNRSIQKSQFFLLIFFSIILFLGSCSSDSSTTTQEKETTATTDASKKPPKKINEETSVPTSKGKTTRTESKEFKLKKQKDLEARHKSMMKQLESTGEVSTADVQRYAKDSEMYMSYYGDSLAAEYAFNAADLYRGIGDYDNALNMWLLVYKAYANDHPKAPHAMFQCAFTYDSILDRKDLAKVLYNSYLKKYPNHELVKDAKLLLKNLDKSPEDLIKEFQKKNQ